jgi:hypothetical protein
VEKERENVENKSMRIDGRVGEDDKSNSLCDIVCECKVCFINTQHDKVMCI